MQTQKPIRRPPNKVVPPRHIIRSIGGCALPTRKMTELSDDSLERQEEIDNVFRRRGSRRRNNAVRLKDSAARLGPVSLAHGKVIFGGDDWGDDISCSVCLSRRWLPWSRLGSNLDLWNCTASSETCQRWQSSSSWASPVQLCKPTRTRAGRIKQLQEVYDPCPWECTLPTRT